MRVDVHTLPPVTSDHYKHSGEARTFDVELQAVATRIADRRATSVAGAFSPATADLVLVVGRKSTGKIEIITVTGTTKLQIDFALAAAARSVIGVATDPLGSAVLRAAAYCPGPATGEVGKRARTPPMQTVTGCRTPRPGP